MEPLEAELRLTGLPRPSRPQDIALIATVTSMRPEGRYEPGSTNIHNDFIFEPLIGVLIVGPSLPVPKSEVHLSACLDISGGRKLSYSLSTEGLGNVSQYRKHSYFLRSMAYQGLKTISGK